jgi:excisionase family DNA binding protein
MSSNIEITRVCQHCGNDFTARTTVTKYCSQKCASMAYKVRTRNEKVKASMEQTKQILSRPVEQLKAREYLSVSEASELVGVSKRTMYRLLERRLLKAGRFGARRIIKRSELDRYFETTTETTEQ